MYFAERNYGCRISEYKIFEYKAVTMENRYLRISILADKGADIFEFLDKNTDTDFMYRDPIGLKKLNGYIPTAYTNMGNFWDYMIGGWYELFPNSGKSCTYRGMLLGQHGETLLMPWRYSIVKNTDKEIEVVFCVETIRAPFYLEKTLRMREDSPLLYISEKVINIGSSEMEFLWGHHITFGEAFLNENCIINLPEHKVFSDSAVNPQKSRIAPGATGSIKRMPGKNKSYIDLSEIPPSGSGISEMLFIKELEDCWYSIFDTKKSLGFGLAWDKKVFPYLWLWQEFNADTDYPWYGRTYSMALEPQSSYIPILSDAVKENMHLSLKPGESIETWLTAVVYKDNRPIKSINRDGNCIVRLQGK